MGVGKQAFDHWAPRIFNAFHGPEADTEEPGLTDSDDETEQPPANPKPPEDMDQLERLS